MERINHDIDERQLIQHVQRGAFQRYDLNAHTDDRVKSQKGGRVAYHSTDGEVGTGALLTTVVHHVGEGPYAWWDEVSWFAFAEFLST